jgi:hypothetical protein
MHLTSVCSNSVVTPCLLRARFAKQIPEPCWIGLKFDRSAQPCCVLNLLERRLMESHTTVTIPFLTTASSSLACSTVPNSPVGFSNVPKPSTRSPRFSSWSVAEGSASGGFLARSDSGVAPGYDRGG